MKGTAWVGIILLVLGIILFAYGIVTLVERSNEKNANNKSFVHYLAVGVGFIFVILGVVFLIKGLKRECKPMSGEICIPVPKNYAREIENSLKSNRKAAFDKSFRPNQQQTQGEVNPFANQ